MAYPTAMRPEDIGVFADPKDVGQLAEPLRSRIYTAILDCNAHFGREALVLVSGRRSPWQQYLLRRERVGAALAFDRRYPGSPRTAIPYTSQHQKGLAADMGGEGLSWLIAHESRYGLARTVSGERWHEEAVGNPIARIVPYPGSTPQKESFTVDAEARAEFEALKKDVSLIKGGLMKMQAWLDDAEKNRFEPTTRRGREVWEKVVRDADD